MVANRGKLCSGAGSRREEARSSVHVGVVHIAGRPSRSSARAFAQARHLRRTPTVLMVSGFGRDVLQLRLDEQQLKVSALLTKPVTPSSLLDACRTALGRSVGGKRRSTAREEATWNTRRA